MLTLELVCFCWNTIEEVAIEFSWEETQKNQ